MLSYRFKIELEFMYNMYMHGFSYTNNLDKFLDVLKMVTSLATFFKFLFLGRHQQEGSTATGRYPTS